VASSNRDVAGELVPSSPSIQQVGFESTKTAHSENDAETLPSAFSDVTLATLEQTAVDQNPRLIRLYQE